MALLPPNPSHGSQIEFVNFAVRNTDGSDLDIEIIYLIFSNAES